MRHVIAVAFVAVFASCAARGKTAPPVSAPPTRTPVSPPNADAEQCQKFSGGDIVKLSITVYRKGWIDISQGAKRDPRAPQWLFANPEIGVRMAVKLGDPDDIEAKVRKMRAFVLSKNDVATPIQTLTKGCEELMGFAALLIEEDASLGTFVAIVRSARHPTKAFIVIFHWPHVEKELSDGLVHEAVRMAFGLRLYR